MTTPKSASPSAAVDTAAVGAWAEAFAAQVTVEESVWAFEALETLLVNAMPAAMQGDKLLAFQRVNSLQTDCGIQGCYRADGDAERALVRLSRAWAAAAGVAVTARPAGADVNLYLPGQYTMKLDDATVRLSMTGDEGVHTLCIAAKKPVKAALRLRIPGWTENACIRVNDEGADEGRPGTYLTLEREWHNGDVVTIEFPQTLRVAEGYHQSASVFYGAKLMAYVPGKDWGMALCGEPMVKAGKVVASFAPVKDWKTEGDVPADMPVRPETEDNAVEAELVPYAKAAVRMAQFPRCKA